MDQHVSYEQHLEFLRKVCSGATLELSGFVDAKFLKEPTLNDPRYMLGFNNGKAKLEIQQVVA